VESVKVKVPVPVLVTLKFAAVGFAAPWIAVKLKVEGEIERTGDPAADRP
jgi:hypothetical protein